MTPDQTARVRESWSLLLPIASVVAERFYEGLFERAPEVRPLFAATDRTAQERKLMQTLAVVVAGLDDLPSLLPAIEALGRRHVGYGTVDAHYDIVGEALLAAFAGALGEAFEPATADAWREAYALLAGAMRRAAAPIAHAAHGA